MYISKLVLDKKVKQRVYQLRYKIYHVELERNVIIADHDRKVLTDSLDQSGKLFACYHNSKLIGTALGNTATDDHLGMYNELYKLSSLEKSDRDGTLFITKLMFDKTARKKLAVNRLLSYMYLYYFDLGFKFCIIDCNDHLINFFIKLGFQQIGTTEHPYYGEVALMKLDLLNFAWLEMVKSPFRHLFKNYGEPDVLF